MPRICLSYCILLIAESTKRRALILGSSSFAISQKPRTARRSFLNNCDGMPNHLAYRFKGNQERNRESFRDAAHNGVRKRQGRLHFSLWARIDGQSAAGAGDIVDASSERCPLRTADLEDVLARGIEWCVQFEERVGGGAIISPMQCLEYGDDVGVAYDGVGQREGDDDLEFERGHVTVHGDFLQCVEEAEVAALGWHFGRSRDALIDDVERGVRDVVVFEQVFGRA